MILNIVREGIDMEDIVPELYREISEKFQNAIALDKEIQDALSEESSASFSKVSLLSRKLGRYAVESLTGCLTEEAMPDGKLYWNIMERTVMPIMQEVHEIIWHMASRTQTKENERQQIRIKPIQPDFPEERVRAVLNKLSNIPIGV